MNDNLALAEKTLAELSAQVEVLRSKLQMLAAQYASKDSSLIGELKVADDAVAKPKWLTLDEIVSPLLVEMKIPRNVYEAHQSSLKKHLLRWMTSKDNSNMDVVEVKRGLWSLNSKGECVYSVRARSTVWRVIEDYLTNHDVGEV